MTSIARRRRSTRSVDTPAVGMAASVGRKTFAELDQDEAGLAREWFHAYETGLDEAIQAVDDASEDAHPDDKEELRDLRTSLVGKKTRAAQREEAFFQEQTLALQPPDGTAIARTKQLTEQMAARIRAERRAQAVVALVNDLADVAIRIGV